MLLQLQGITGNIINTDNNEQSNKIKSIEISIKNKYNSIIK